MNIFKEGKFLNKEKMKQSRILRRLYNEANKFLLIVCVIFNIVMIYLMLERTSVFFVFFLANIYFLAMLRKGRKFQID